MFGIKKLKRWILIHINFFRFNIRKWLFGFEISNLFLQRVDKFSMQFILKKNGAIIGKDCDVESGQIFHNCKDYSNLNIGDNCHIGKNCFFDLKDKIIIKDNVVISMQCTFITHLDLARSKLSQKYLKAKSSITICEDCYIGVKTIILKGVVLNKEVLVSANSTITESFGSNILIGGTPAKYIKKI